MRAPIYVTNEAIEMEMGGQKDIRHIQKKCIEPYWQNLDGKRRATLCHNVNGHQMKNTDNKQLKNDHGKCRHWQF